MPLQEIALLVQTHGLASVAETGVYGQRTLLPQGRRQQELFEILPEYFDGLGIRLLLRLLDYLVRDGRIEQTLPRIFDRRTDLHGEKLRRI